MRPRFEIPLRAPRALVLAAVRRELAARDGPLVEGAVLARGAELTTHRSRVHFWSPHLSIELRDDEAGGATLHGRFGPHEGVWTLFVGIYGVLGMAGLGALMYGLSQAMLGQRPWALLGIVGALALAAFTCGAGFIGQGLGAAEMHVLRSFVERCVADAERAHADESATADVAAGI
jgi:hypothetical protein